MWGWLVNFWRTLFERQLGPYRPSYPVTRLDQPSPTTVTISQAPPGFQTLAFSSTSFAHGTPASGTILNATATSVIVAVGLPLGLTINSTARTWAWSGTGLAGSGSLTLYENIPGAPTNPKVSVIAYTITGGGGQLDFNAAVQSGLIILLEDI